MILRTTVGTVSAFERTFRRAAAGATPEGGVDLVLDAISRFMHAVIDAEPLQALCQREPHRAPVPADPRLSMGS